MAGFLSGMAGGATVAVTIKAIDEFSGTFKDASLGMKGLTVAAGAAVAGAAALGTAMYEIGAASLKTAADFQQTEIAFTTMLGSAQKAQDFLNQVRDFAKKTPFELNEVVTASQRLLAFGITAEEVLPDLESLGNIAAGVGRDKLPQLILAFGQVSAAGKLTGQELRQFTEAGVPLLEELAKNFGVTTAEVRDLISSGTVGFEDVKKALGNLSAEGGRFAGLMQKQMGSVAGKFSNVKDAIYEMQLAIGKELVPVFSDLVDVILKEVIPAVQPLIPLVGDALKTVVKDLTPLLRDNIDKFVNLGEVLFGRVLPALEPLIPIFVELVGMALELAGVIAENLVPFIQVAVKEFQMIYAVIKPVLDVVIRLLSPLIEAAGSFEGLLNVLIPLEPVLTMIGKAIEIILWPLNKLIESLEIAVGWFKDLLNISDDYDRKSSSYSSSSKSKSSSSKSSGLVYTNKSSASSDWEEITNQFGTIRLGPQTSSSSNVIRLNDFILTKSGKIIQPSSEDTLVGTKNGLGNEVNVYIDSIYGTDPEEMMRAFKQELSKRISLA